jgi:hypothetical protein
MNGTMTEIRYSGDSIIVLIEFPHDQLPRALEAKASGGRVRVYADPDDLLGTADPLPFPRMETGRKTP